MKKTSLGKGLSALIDENSYSALGGGFIPALPIKLVVPNPYQPRTDLDPDMLMELADSIRQHGVIEPLLVTKKSEHKYELIAGERRLRAAKLAGMDTIPVVVKEASPQQMLELAIIENLQREDLNPLEEAMAFEQLAKTFNLTHTEIGKKIGKSRPAVANKVRLLSLPEQVRKALLEGKISEGHARGILGIKDPKKTMEVYKMVIKNNLSVRGVEELVRRMNNGKTKINRIKGAKIYDDKTIKLETNLRSKFGEKVVLSRSTKGGKIVIPFSSENELDKLVDELL